MVSRLYIPGLAEYGRCKEAFLRAEELLAQKQASEHQEELSDLLQALNTAPDAVDFLEAEFGKEYLRVYRRLSDACIPAFLLDEYAADGGKKRLPTEWYDSWSAVTDGRVMASMGDLYAAFKVIRKMHSGSEQEQAKAKSLLLSLREDFDWPGKRNWLIGGTRLFYSGNSLDTRIVQHYRCNKPELVTEKVLEVPVYNDKPVPEVVSEKHGLPYVHTLLDTIDDPETILQTLEFISGKSRADIRFWTAGWSGSSQQDVLKKRAEHPERAAGFGYNGSQFRVGGRSINGDPGCSRGVRR